MSPLVRKSVFGWRCHPLSQSSILLCTLKVTLGSSGVSQCSVTLECVRDCITAFGVSRSPSSSERRGGSTKNVDCYIAHLQRGQLPKAFCSTRSNWAPASLWLKNLSNIKKTVPRFTFEDKFVTGFANHLCLPHCIFIAILFDPLTIMWFILFLST